MQATRIYFRKLWWVGLIILAVISGVIFLVITNQRNRNANLEVSVTPDDATVIIEGERFSPGKISVDPGTYDIDAKREGFETLTQRVTVSDDLLPVVFALTPVSDEAKEWAKKNQRAYADAEAAGGVAAQEQAKSLTEKYPLVSKLPFDGSFYKINYAIEDRQKNTIYIRIDSNAPVGRQVGLEQIKEWGYEPTDYKIIFPGLSNPLDPTTVEINGE